MANIIQDNLQNEKELYFFSGNDIMKLNKTCRSAGRQVLCADAAAGCRIAGAA